MISLQQVKNSKILWILFLSCGAAVLYVWLFYRHESLWILPNRLALPPPPLPLAATHSNGVIMQDDKPNWATPVYGIYRKIPMAQGQQKSARNEPPIEMVYSTLTTSSPMPRGIVHLLHACTHNALKFFSPSQTGCPQCVGLSEELRIVRLVQERHYIPVAVTCVDAKSGCWSDRDIPRLRQAIRSIQGEIGSVFELSLEKVRRLPVIAIGASSGGYMAAKLAAMDVADAALVMVMGLQPKLEQMLAFKKDNKPPLYLAPMPRDERTLQRNRENYHNLVGNKYNGNMNVENRDNSIGSGDGQHLRVALDETTCQPLPLMVDYLLERVVGMTYHYAVAIVDALRESGHIGQDDLLFRKDPTKSSWRQILLALEPPRAPTDDDNRAIAIGMTGFPSSEILWGQFRLTRGHSPLAKAFHRAWAFHEYCSEAVPLALEFFEHQIDARL